MLPFFFLTLYYSGRRSIPHLSWDPKKNKLNVYIERYDPNTTQGTTTMFQFCVFRVLIFFVLFNLGKILH